MTKKKGLDVKPKPLFYMVRLKGLEPLTYGLEGQGRCTIGNKRAINATIKTEPYTLALFPVDCE